MNETDMPSPVLITTERLYIREFTKEDVDAVYEYAGDADNCAFMDWAPESREGVAAFIDGRLASQIAEPRLTYDLALCLRESGELIGAMGLFLDNKREQAEIGWVLNKKYWHMGYASEAARGFLRFGFMGLDLHRIYAKCDTENRASYSLMERLGMRREARFEKNAHTIVRQRLGWRSTYVYAMLRKEFLNSLSDGEYDPTNSQFVN